MLIAQEDIHLLPKVNHKEFIADLLFYKSLLGHITNNKSLALPLPANKTSPVPPMTPRGQNTRKPVPGDKMADIRLSCSSEFQSPPRFSHIQDISKAYSWADSRKSQCRNPGSEKSCAFNASSSKLKTNLLYSESPRKAYKVHPGSSPGEDCHLKARSSAFVENLNCQNLSVDRLSDLVSQIIRHFASTLKLEIHSAIDLLLPMLLGARPWTAFSFVSCPKVG